MILEWVGPFDPCDPSQDSLRPPQEAGIYLWVIKTDPGWRVSYVGETGNLANRCYEHVVATLGGGYWLYDPEGLEEGSLIEKYKPSPSDFNVDFTGDFLAKSKLAMDNLRAYRVCWARFAFEASKRRAVEHALIWWFTRLKGQDHPDGQLLQNGPRYHWPEALRGDRVELSVVKGPEILSLPDGTLSEEGLHPNG